MKRTAALIAAVLLMSATPARAATLIDGSQINREWKGLNGKGLEMSEALSGWTMYVSRAFSGAGLLDCDNSVSSKLLWDATSGRFSCGTDQTGSSSFGTGNVITTGDSRYVN